MEIRDLYQQLLIEHGMKPRNYGELQDSTHHQQEFNPLCGDQVTVWLKIEDSRIIDLKFTNVGCVISTASASMMTEELKGLTVGEAMDCCLLFDQTILSGEMADWPGDLSCLSGICEHPSRFKCATLPWKAVTTILDKLN